jgi:ferredoxin-type protein NapH
MVFVTMCILTTSIAILFGAVFAPRAWCSFCPMGTMQRALGGSKYQLQVKRDLCIECGKCRQCAIVSVNSSQPCILPILLHFHR